MRSAARSDSGGAVCGVGNDEPGDNRRLSIRFDIGGTETHFSAGQAGLERFPPTPT